MIQFGTGGWHAVIGEDFICDNVRRVAAGGGVDNENITVREVPLDDVDAWLAAQVEQGIALDPRIFTGLYFLKNQKSV